MYFFLNSNGIFTFEGNSGTLQVRKINTILYYEVRF